MAHYKVRLRKEEVGETDVDTLVDVYADGYEWFMDDTDGACRFYNLNPDDGDGVRERITVAQFSSSHLVYVINEDLNKT